MKGKSRDVIFILISLGFGIQTTCATTLPCPELTEPLRNISENGAKIDLQHLNITCIPAGAFMRFTKLQELWLSYNKISKIEDNAFDGQENLFGLFIGNNELTTINSTWFTNLTSLKWLTLSNNPITEVNNGDFPPSLKNVTELYFSSTNIASLKSDIFKEMGSLTLLTMTRNDHLSVINSGTFNNLGKLQMLSLSSRLLDDLPTGIFNELGSLRSLTIRTSNLTRLKRHYFAGLKSLEMLMVSSNPIPKLDVDSFAEISNISLLGLNGCGIREIENGTFDKMNSLERLQFLGNNLSTIDIEMFAGLRSMTQLEIDHDNIVTIHPQAFQETKSLRILSISNNKISSIPSQLFAELGNLKTLTLSSNQISIIKPDDFTGLHNLTQLDMSGNMIRIVPLDILKELGSLRTFDLRQNPLTMATIISIKQHPQLNRILIVGDVPFDSSSCKATTSIAKSLCDLGASKDQPNQKSKTIKTIASRGFTSSVDLQAAVMALNAIQTTSDALNDPNVVQDIAETFEHIIKLQNAAVTEEGATEVRMSLDLFTSSIPVINQTRVVAKTSLAIGLVNLANTGTTHPYFAMHINNPDASATIEATVQYGNVSQSPEYIQIPQQAAQVNSARRLEFRLLKHSNIFVSKKANASSVINSHVISAHVPGAQISLLQHPVIVRLRSVNNQRKIKSFRCVFWDENKVEWSSTGCSAIMNPDSSTTCACTHLTNFAVMTEFEELFGQPFLIIVCIGSALSIIALILVAFSYARMKSHGYDLRAQENVKAIVDEPMRLMIVWESVTLAIALAIFIVQAVHKQNDIGCKAVGALSQFLFLSVVFWSVAQSIFLYLAFVRENICQNAATVALRSGLFALGIPLIIVIISLAVNVNNYGMNKLCWITEPKLYLIGFGYFAFIAAALLINLILYIGIYRSGRKKGLISLTFCNYGLPIISCIMIGLAWIFATLGNFRNYSLPFEILCAIMQSLQGLVHFLIYVLAKPNVRDFWQHLCGGSSFREEPESRYEMNNAAHTSGVKF